MRANAPKARVALRIREPSAFRVAMAAGYGAFFWPCFAGDTAPTLQRVGPIADGFARKLWLLMLLDLKGTSRLRAFVHHASEFFESRRSLLAGEGS